MTMVRTSNRQFLTDLFTGPFRGHAMLFNPPVKRSARGDFALSEKPVGEWVGEYVEQYELRTRWREAVGDDAVPYVGLNTNTGVFAAAFGCPVHVYDADTNAAAMPIVTTAEEADKLPEPTLEAPTIARCLELARLLRRELGDDASIGVPDIQSPLDIAALIWSKEHLFLAMLETPEAVERLIAKCARLLKKFLVEFLKQVPAANLCHCPYAWAPARLGCWLSEDEVGAISTELFARFALPCLTDLSEMFGGIFIHCCAAADHQYGGFLRVPNLRGLNRVFQTPPGPQPAIRAFSGQTVFMQAWLSEAEINHFLDIARPDTRYLFNPRAENVDEAKGIFERFRERCPRV